MEELLMTTAVTQVISDSDWYDTYDPEEKFYETYGEDLEYIKSMPDNFVWTLVDGDEDSVVVNGKAFVNRLGYYLSKKPHNTNDLIVVEFDAS
jgi:hypothetical protein